MNFRLRIAEQDFTSLRDLVLSAHPKEAAAFTLAGVSTHGQETNILVRRIVPIPEDMYDVQHQYRLDVSARAVNGLASLCEANGLGAVLCHSHPSEIPYSPTDDDGEARVFGVLRRFIPASAPTASLLFWPGGVTGRVWLPGEDHPLPLTEIVVVGRHLQRIITSASGPANPEGLEPAFDRQVRAFGLTGQARIRATRVAVVGVGGTGSPTAEQLVRLGVRDLLLVDPGEFELSNRSRMFGTFAGDEVADDTGSARKKVALVADHLRHIEPSLRVEPVPRSIVTRAAEGLRDRDVIFLCTDEHWGRSIVNQVSYQYLIPVVNVGVSIAAANGRPFQAAGVVDVLRPDVACLWCRQFLRASRIAAEAMPKSERDARRQEGYVEDVDTPAPSVVSMTTALSGMAVSLFLQLVTDFMGPAGAVERLNYDVMDGTVRRGRCSIEPGCVCKKVRGFGDLAPLTIVEPGPQ